MKMNLNKTFLKNTVDAINGNKFRWNFNPVYIWFTWDGVVLYEIDYNFKIHDYFASKNIPVSENLTMQNLISEASIILDDNGQMFTIEDFNHVLKGRKECYMLRSGGEKYYFQKKYINQFLKANYQYSIFRYSSGLYGVMVYQYDDSHHIQAFNDLLTSVVFVLGVCINGQKDI